VKKLSFLDYLKQNMGEEMTEQMSEEITKAMDEQRSLEQKYASLVTRRGQLKGLSDKKELAETKAQIS
jgi:ribonucleotide reductase beta subunit family protein with ferritin-like domain